MDLPITKYGKTERRKFGSAKQLRPAITVLDASGNKVGNSMLPDGAILTVKDGDMVAVGSTPKIFS